MKNVFHTGLEDRWDHFTLVEQMANIGAEVGRTINWRKKGNMEMSRNAFYRSLELLDLTINDRKNEVSVKEVLRTREALVDFFLGDNIYKSSESIWEKYFYYFNFLARKNR